MPFLSRGQLLVVLFRGSMLLVPWDPLLEPVLGVLQSISIISKASTTEQWAMDT